MKKKLLAGAITLLSVATLAACSNSSEGADLITMKGDVITEHQFYEEVKNNSTAQQVLLNMTIQKVFEKQYGSEVSEKEVDAAGKNKLNLDEELDLETLSLETVKSFERLAPFGMDNQKPPCPVTAPTRESSRSRGAGSGYPHCRGGGSSQPYDQP